jgi:pyrroloquinoline-quinone synthase
VDFWTRLDAVRSEWNVLEHSFYRRWSAGELSREELAAYSGQYRHAVVALAEASASAAARAGGPLRGHLEEHAADEASHVALWDRFTAATGGDVDAPASPETEACARAWRGSDGRSLEAALVALYAIEAAQPAIAEAKRDGLTGLYGFEPGPATEYFDLHATLDVEHARAHREWIEATLDDADHDELIAAAREVLSGNWTLLDGVERASLASAAA